RRRAAAPLRGSSGEHAEVPAVNPLDLILLSKEESGRFRLIGIVPAATLAVFILVLVWSGAPGESPKLSRIGDHAAELSGWQGALLTVALLVLALVFQPLQLAMVRLLEGYWGHTTVATWLAWPGRRIHCGRWRAIRQALKPSPMPSAEGVRRAVSAALDQRLYPPDEQDVLPTRLGNVLRAAEQWAGRDYGLRAVVIWPRLYPLLSERVQGVV